MQEFGQVWSGRVRQVKRAMSRMLLIKAPIIFRSYLPWSVSSVSARSEMLRALGEGGVMQESWALGRFGVVEGGQWAGGGRASQVAGKGAGGEPACGMQELPPASSPPVSRQFLMLKTNNQILGSTFPMLNTYSKVFGSTNISHCYLMPNYEIFYFDSS